MSAENANNINLAENLQVAIISGGRPKLKQRATARLLTPLKNAGIKNIAWVVSEKDAPQYENDEHPIETYSTEWAYNYAAAHWMKPEKPNPGDFLGAFPGREWACHLAARNHCRYLLQLDDNIQRLSISGRNTAAASETAKQLNGLLFFAQTLTNITAATNTRMCGAQLSAVAGNKKTILARPGFPYSLFIEQIDNHREPWYGPFEDDITHAYQYGTRADGATASLAPLLTYCKESKSKTGMRSNYQNDRARYLQQIFPETANVTYINGTANGRGEGRIFHRMKTGAIRNPLTITNPELWNATRQQLTNALNLWGKLEAVKAREKVIKRTKGKNG